MAKISASDVQKYAEEIMESLDDGFQWSDLFKIIPTAMEVVERVKGLSGVEKKESVIEIIHYVIDNTDVPWLPDSFVDPILKSIAPTVIELVIKASKGEIGVNKPA